MGTDVFALTTRWEPMVAAFRSAGGLGFYWDANARHNEEPRATWAAGERSASSGPPNLLPYATESDFWGGRAFVVAGDYYDCLRPHLPVGLRKSADALMRLLYQGVFDPDPRAWSDDLSVDAGVPRDPDVLYAMRPATVRTALDRDGALPWADLARVAGRVTITEPWGRRYVPDYTAFESVIQHQRAWLREAAAADRGLVVIISQ
jgi:hypothetical protein